MRRSSLLMGVAAALAIAALLALMPMPTRAAAHAEAQCFMLQSWTGGWRASADGRSIYLRLNTGQVYQLQLDGSHPMLNYPLAVLHSRTYVDTGICGPLDLQLTVSDGTGARDALIVRKMLLLTPSQVAALPKNVRP